MEGKARDIPQADNGVRVERAPGSGDDKIVDLVRDAAPTRRTVVVTADRGLRDRVRPWAPRSAARPRSPADRVIRELEPATRMAETLVMADDAALCWGDQRGRCRV